jgi:hypothetical protein
MLPRFLPRGESAVGAANKFAVSGGRETHQNCRLAVGPRLLCVVEIEAPTPLLGRLGFAFDGFVKLLDGGRFAG